MIKKLIERLKQSGIDVQILETTPVNSDKGRLILNDLTNMSADYILKETSLWNEVIQDPLYIGIRDYDDYIASEALARISGKSNAAKLEEIAKQTAEQDKIRGKQTTSGIILNRLRSALGKFWSWVGTHMFNIKQFNSVDEVTDRVLYDLLNKTQIKSDESAKREADNNINHGKGRKI